MNRPIVSLPQPPQQPQPGQVAQRPTAPPARPQQSQPAQPSPAAAAPAQATAPFAMPAVQPLAAPAASPFASPTPAAAPPPMLPQPAPPQPAAAPASSAARPAATTGFRIGLAQIICWQLALVSVAISAGGPLGGLIGTSAGALALVAVTAVPVRGAWPHQWAAIAVRFLLRRRQAELPETTSNPDTAATALLKPWIGDTALDATAVRDRPLALVSNPAAVSALLRLDPATGAGSVRVALAGLLATDTDNLLDALDEQVVEVEVQLVIHTGLRHDRDPRGWVAIAARRAADLSTDDQHAMVLRNAVRRLQRQLERNGAATVPVDDREAATTLVALAHAGAGRGHVRERWTTWSAGPVSQACLRLTGCTRLDPKAAAALVDVLAGTAVNASVTISAAARLDARTQAVERRDPVLRVAAASDGALDVAITVLSRLIRAYGLQPERLDGRHGPAMAASLPIARSLV